MKTGWLLAGLLLASGTMILRANPVASPGCTLKPVQDNRRIKIFYTTSQVTSGCASQGPTDLDVHVIFLLKSKVIPLPLNVTGEAAAASHRKTVFILGSHEYAVWKVVVEDHQLPLSFVTSNGFTEDANVSSTQQAMSSHDLLTWARANYGGVSSFTELESPEGIHFHVGNVNSSNEDCIPRRDYDADPYLEARFASHNIRSCSASGEHHQKEAHILWLKQAAPESGTQEVDVNVEVTCREGNPANPLPMLLVFKSHESIFWNLGEMPNSVSLAISGKYGLKRFGSHEIEGEKLPASEAGLIQTARTKDFAFIASYTEVPFAKSLALELVTSCEELKKETTPKPRTEVLTPGNMIQNFVTICQPWRCTDNTMEISLPKTYLEHLQGFPKVSEVTLQDSSCKATDNSTHFVLKSALDSCSTAMEGGVLAKNKLVLSLAPLGEKVMVPFECPLPEKVFLQLYPTPDFSSAQTTVIEVNKASYVQISLRSPDKKAETEIEDCALHTPDQVPPQLLIAGGKPQSYAATFLSSPGHKIHRFSFVYKAGGEPWSVASATLVCTLQVNSQSRGSYNHESVLEVTLRNPNVPSRSQGLGIGTVLGITFGAFLIGVLLTGALWYIYSHTRSTAKRPAAAADPPASESSSTNHSIGSTQSTPCSTSSMA